MVVEGVVLLLKHTVVFDPMARNWIPRCFQPSVHSETATLTMFHLWVWKMNFFIVESRDSIYSGMAIRTHFFQLTCKYQHRGVGTKFCKNEYQHRCIDKLFLKQVRRRYPHIGACKHQAPYWWLQTSRSLVLRTHIERSPEKMTETAMYLLYSAP